MTIKKGKIKSRFILNTATIVTLAFCLCITTYALIASVLVNDNIFSTGIVDVEISKLTDYSDTYRSSGDMGDIYDSLRMEPGMTIEKCFYIENNSTCDIWYKFQFADVTGELAKVLDVKITEKSSGDVLYEGKAADMMSDCEKLVPHKMSKPASESDKKTEFSINFYLPEIEGNRWKGGEMDFRLKVIATQFDNNPNAEF